VDWDRRNEIGEEGGRGETGMMDGSVFNWYDGGDSVYVRNTRVEARGKGKGANVNVNVNVNVNGWIGFNCGVNRDEMKKRNK
jgi:hypothetical protein